MRMQTQKIQAPEMSPGFPSAFQFLSRSLAIACVAAMLIAVTIEVVARSFFGFATIWVTEVSTYLIVAIAFLGTAYAASQDGHIRVDILTSRLSPTLATPLLDAARWLSLGVSIIVLWKTTAFLTESYISGSRSWSMLNTPIWIPQLSISCGILLMVLFFSFEQKTQNRYRSLNLLLRISPIIAVVTYLMLEATGQIQTPLSPVQNVLLVVGAVSASILAISGPRSFIAATLILVPVSVFFAISGDSELVLKSIVLVSGLLFFLFLGIPVVFSLFLIGVLAMTLWLPAATITYIGERSWGALNTFELAAIPMFVLMGAILVRSNASTEMFKAAEAALGRTRGGLAHASILASSVFAAVSGSSLATAATMGRVAGPAMMDEKYRPELAYGVLAAGGTLGILIPPSIAMIVYGPIAGVPVTDLFVAGMIPGLLMVIAFVIVIFIWSYIQPSAAPAGQPVSWMGKLRALKGVAPFLALMSMILGSLYFGIATPTEAAAVGVLGAIGISAFRGTLTLEQILSSLEEAALVTSFILMIAVASAVMGFAIDFLSMPQSLVSFVNTLNLSDIALFCAIIILYLILGMFVEPISMVLMTLPVILPIITAAGWDPLWFGIILVMLVEIGLITPPVGMILYVLTGVGAGRVNLYQVSVGAIPFIIAFIGMVFLFFFFPKIITFLPEMAK